MYLFYGDNLPVQIHMQHTDKGSHNKTKPVSSQSQIWFQIWYDSPKYTHALIHKLIYENVTT